MSQSLIRTNLEQSLEATSLGDLARSAEVVMLLLDTSGSMSMPLAAGGRRIDGLRETVKNITARGRVPMIAFGGPFDAEVRFVEDVPEPSGGTPLHLAIPFAKQYGASRLVIISDGQPDLLDECLEQARAFGGQIDVVFVGDSNEGGLTFLEEMARRTGGSQFTGTLGDPKQLSGMIIGLLEGPKEPEKAPIVGAGFSVVETEDEDEDEDDDDTCSLCEMVDGEHEENCPNKEED